MKKTPYCPKCKIMKTIGDFHKNGNGLAGCCKKCHAKRQKEYYKRTIEKRRAKAREYQKTDYSKLHHIVYRKILRLNVLQHYSRSEIPKCACCGETTLEFLGIDHINGGGCQLRKKNKNHRGEYIYAWLAKNDYPDGFRILCHNCNSAIGSYGYCPHEEGSKYLDVLTKFKPKKKCAWLTEKRILSLTKGNWWKNHNSSCRAPKAAKR